MNESPPPHPTQLSSPSDKVSWQSVKYQRITLFLALGWLVLVSGSLVLEIWQIRNHIEELARNEARATYNKDVMYRRWATMHGGVYVPPTAQSPPNPYLQVPDRDVTTTSGQKLTLINPAYMTRQVHEMDPGTYGTRGHITSLKPIRPENAADAWETNALRAFESGAKEVTSVEMLDGRRYMRLMRPMVVEAGCLKCHSDQGYREGNVRGGVSVSVPMAPYSQMARSSALQYGFFHSTLGILGLAGLWVARQKFHRFIIARQDHEKEILRLNQLYLALSQVNQLITRVQTQDELMIGACQMLVQHGRLKMAWVGRHDLETHAVIPVAQFGDEGGFLQQIKVYADERPEGLGPAGRAIREMRPKIINDLAHAEETQSWHEIGARHGFGSVGAFPIIQQGNVYGALIVYAAEPEFFRDKEIRLFEGVAMDLSFAFDHLEQKAHKERAETELRQKTEELNRYFASALDLLFIADTQGYFRRLNPEWQHTLGYPLEELQHCRFLDLVHPDDQDATLKAIAQLSDQQLVLHFTNRYRHRDGSYRWIEWRALPQGELIYAVARDVTQQREAIEALKASEAALRIREQEFRHLAEAMPQLVWMCRPDGWNIYFNQRWVEYTGLSLEESYGHGWNKPFHPDDQQRAREAWKQATETGGTYDLECRLRRADGAYHWFIIRGLPLRDSDGRIVKWLGTCTDINDLKRAEEAMRLSEEKFATAFANNPAALALTRLEDGRFIDVNNTWSTLLGYSREEAIGNFAREMRIWPDTESAIRFVRTLEEKGSLHGWEQAFYKKSGELFISQLSAQLLSIRGEKVILSTLVDLTERLRAQEALGESQQRLDLALRSLQMGVWDWDIRNNQMTWDDQMFRLHGITQRPSKYGIEIWENSLHPDDQAQARAACQAALREEQDFDIDFRIKHSEGATRYIKAKGLVLKDKSGNPNRMLGISYDITERKQLEKTILTCPETGIGRAIGRRSRPRFQ